MRANSKVNHEDDGSVLCKDTETSSFLEGMVEDEERAEIVTYAEPFRLDIAPVEGALGGAAAKGHRGAAESGGTRGEKASKPDAVHVLDSDATAARDLLPPARGCTLVEDTLWHGRWAAHYPSPVTPYITSTSWGLERV